MLPNNDFEKNSRRQQEITMRPVIDAIYAKVWPGCTIKRFDSDEDKLLDIKYGIDVQVTLPSGMILLGQEKALSHRYATFRTVTVEYLNDPKTGDKGDWYHLAPQFYFCGYATADNAALKPWVLLNWPSVVLGTTTKKIAWVGPIDNSKSPAKASFVYIQMDAIPNDCVIASEGLTLQPQSFAPVKTEQQQVKELIANMTIAELRDVISEVLFTKKAA